MSIIWDLSKKDFSSNPKTKKLFKLRKDRTFHLTKSYSFNNKKFNEKSLNNDILRQLFRKNNKKNISKEEKLRDRNNKLKMKLNNINQELILAKSANHKKISKIKQNNKLLISAINIKKLTLDLDKNNATSSSNYFYRKTEEDITLKGFKSNLIYKIKKQYLEVEKENKNRQDIIANLQNNIKNYDNNALLKRNKELTNKLISLKDKYDANLERNNEFKLQMKEYRELEDKLNKKNFCILELNESLRDINKLNNDLENDIEKLKNKLKKLEFENENLNSEYYFLNEKFIQASKEKNEIENKISIFFDENKDN